MQKQNRSLWLRGVLCLLGFVFAVANVSAAIVYDQTYDLLTAPDPLPDWTETGLEGRVGNVLSTNGNTLTYTRTDLALNNREAFMIEAVMSADVLGGVGERGARLWASFFDPDAPGFPPGDKSRLVEIRLLEGSGGNRRISLFDGVGGTEMANLALDWAVVAPRFRIRLMRQLIGSTDFMVLQAGPSDAGEVQMASAQAALSGFNMVLANTNELGFGHAVAGTFNSHWESIRVIATDDQATLLPPAVVPVPASVWLFATGLLGLVGIARRKAAKP